MHPRFVLLHGFTNSGQLAAGDLGARRTYRAVAPDIRGMAYGGLRRARHPQRVIDDVAAVTPEPFTLVGYSQGGRIALHIALALPHRVARLVLIGRKPRARRRR